MAEEATQRVFLSEAKRQLAARHSKLTWEAFAKLAGIKPRALKTYLMPEGSPEFRAMPPRVRKAIQDLITEVALIPPVRANPKTPANESPALEVLLPSALAALVVRQARQVLLERRAISGVDRYPGDQLGLLREDRTAMALVSRTRLKSGLTDIGAEIHELLHQCTRPLGEWLPLPSIHAERLSQVVLLDPEELVPTLEGEELARRFTTTSATLEELLFSRLAAELQKSSRAAADSYYTRVREFIVRHAIATAEDLRELIADLPSSVGMLIGQQFYQPVPEGWAVEGYLRICAQCGNALKSGPHGDECRTRACSESLAVSSSHSVALESALRLSRGIRQYWQEPGFDEVRLFDELTAAGLPALLYPQQDRVDIEVGDVGIDLKAYVSPELLGARLNRNVGGLAHYKVKWLVIPDRLIRRIPAYLERLRGALDGTRIRALAASHVLRELQHA
jgi:hypothetical protein